MAAHDWTSIFCERPAQMQALKDAFTKVTSAGTLPQVVVLLGDSGLGKTRLVQEFYNWLTTTQNGGGTNGYWPTRLTRIGNNLQVNPPASGIDTESPMHFLWWGMRLEDPGRYNVSLSGSVISSSLEFLRPHMEAIYRKRRLLAYSEEKEKIAKDLSLSALTEFIPFSGTVKESFEAAAALKQLREKQTHDALESKDARDIQQRHRVSIVDAVFTDFAAFFEDMEHSRRTPAIVFIDDAHWAKKDDDPGLFDLFHRLYVRGCENNWPILFVVTHWEAEWHLAENVSGSFRSEFELLVKGNEPHWNPFSIDRVPDLSAMLESAFPGLTQDQSTAILNKADGNPRLLDEIIRWLETHRGLFVGRDHGNQLTSDGAVAINGESFDLKKLVAERLQHAPDDVQAALALSALQSPRFIATLTAELSAKLALGNGNDGVEKGIEPYRFINRVENAACEFSQRVYWEVASERLRDLTDTAQAEDALRSVIHQFVESKRSWTLSILEAEAFLSVAIKLLEDSAQQSDRELAGQCLLHSVQLNLRRLDYDSAHRAARKFLSGVRSNRWQLESFDNTSLDWALDSLLIMDRPEEAELLARFILDRNKSQVDCSPDKSDCHELFSSLFTMAQLTKNQGHLAESEQFSKEAFELASKAFERTKTAEARHDLSSVLSQLSLLASMQSRWTEADQLSRASLEHAEVLAAELKTSSARQNRSAVAGNVAFLAQKLGRLEEAERVYRDVLKWSRELLEEKDSPPAREHLLVSLEHVAALAEEQGHFEEAEKFNREQLVLARGLADKLKTPQARNDLAISLSNVARLVGVQGRFEEAQRLYDEALELARGLAMELGTPDLRGRLQLALNNVAGLAEHAGRLDDAERLRREELEIGRALASELNTHKDREHLIIAILHMARLAELKGLREEAKGLYREGLLICRTIAKNADTPGTREDLSDALAGVRFPADEQDRLPDVHLLCQELLELNRALSKEKNTPQVRRSLRRSLDREARYSRREGRLVEAEQLCRESLQLCQDDFAETKTPSARGALSVSLDNVARVLAMQGRAAEAEPLYKEALEHARKRTQEDHSSDARHDLSLILNNMGGFVRRQGRLNEADKLYREQLTIARALENERKTSEASSDLSNALINVARVAETQSFFKLASKLFREELELSRVLAGANDTVAARRNLSISLHHVARLAATLGHSKEAEGLYREAVPLARSVAAELNTQKGRQDAADLLFVFMEFLRKRGRHDELLKLQFEHDQLIGAPRWTLKGTSSHNAADSGPA